MSTAQSQERFEVPLTWQYQPQLYPSPAPFVHSGDVGCQLVADYLNKPPRPAERFDYTNPRYFTGDPSYGHGCVFDLVSRGGMGGYPEGHVLKDVRQENWVIPRAVCPIGYVHQTVYTSGGAEQQFCSGPRKVELGSCESACDITVGD